MNKTIFLLQKERACFWRRQTLICNHKCQECDLFIKEIPDAITEAVKRLHEMEEGDAE